MILKLTMPLTQEVREPAMIVASSPVASTTLGELRGTTDSGIHVFKGIPYGAPVSGRARWLPPQPAHAWSGVRAATRFGPAAPQATRAVRPPALVAAIGQPAVLDAGQAEDCLVVNVWTPGLADGVGRPVLVWIHGGGYYSGSGASLHTQGTNLARRGDVVVVTLNHRLGVLGYLKLDHLLGADYAAAGVAGMLDLVLALDWVRDNATAFGGDPSNVSIFGCSGGGSKVSHLMAMPEAQGLFTRAIVQSGPGLRSMTPEAGADLTNRLLVTLGLSEAEADQLLVLPSEQLMDAQSKLVTPGAAMLGGSQVGPVLTDHHLPAHPFEPSAAPTAAKVPLIIGCNKDEMALGLGFHPRLTTLDDAGAQAWIVGALGDRAAHLLPIYRRQRPEANAGDLLITVLSDYMRTRSIRLAERKAAGGSAPVFMYRFDWQTPVAGGKLRSCHALEVPFVFDNVEVAPITGTQPERTRLAAQVSTAWIDFARSGDPGHSGLTEWPTYAPTDRATMLFNVDSRVVKDPDGAEREAWSAFD
ncbi:MAG: carboxylesterase/lipase family protein [Chloroflexi bacterium]|nr:carboxylesterase/lipase family protein [Chloroflexota bacterium]